MSWVESFMQTYGPFGVLGFLGLSLCGLIALALSLRARLRQRYGLPPLERRSLLTPTETRFLAVLRSAFPDLLVLAQLSMGALLKPVRGLDRGEWWRAYNGIAQKRVDFALCTPAGEIVVLIELDDASHDAKSDAYRDRVLALGGYRVIRFHVKQWPSVVAIRAAVSANSNGNNVRLLQRARRAA